MTTPDRDRITTAAVIALWLVMTVAVVARVGTARIGVQSVVPIYRIAGERSATGRPLYDVIPEYDLYRNPPVVAAVMTMTLPLPPKAGEVAVRLAQLGVFAAGLVRVLTLDALGLSRHQRNTAGLLAALLILPAFNNGQLNVLVAGSLLHALAAVARGRPTESAVWCAVAASVKLYPAAIGCLYGLARPRLALRFALATVAIGLVPLLTQSPEVVADQYADYWAALDDDRTGSAHERVPRDWTCWPRMALGVVVGAKAAFVVSLVAAGAVALATLAARPGLTRLLTATLLGHFWMTAFGPSTEANTYTLLSGVAPVALALSRPGWGRALAWCGVMLLLSPGVRGAWPHDWRYTVYGPQPLGAMLVTAAGWAGVRRAGPG